MWRKKGLCTREGAALGPVRAPCPMRACRLVVYDIKAFTTTRHVTSHNMRVCAGMVAQAEKGTCS